MGCILDVLIHRPDVIEEIPDLRDMMESTHKVLQDNMGSYSPAGNFNNQKLLRSANIAHVLTTEKDGLLLELGSKLRKIDSLRDEQWKTICMEILPFLK